jgi:hypothetical protein
VGWLAGLGCDSKELGAERGRARGGAGIAQASSVLSQGFDPPLIIKTSQAAITWHKNEIQLLALLHDQLQE